MQNTTSDPRNSNRLRASLAVATALALSVGLTALTGAAIASAAEPEPGDDGFLGTAEDFAIIAAATVTETAGTVVVGDVALTPGTEVQLQVVQVEGAIHVGTDAVAILAGEDLTAAYVTLAGADATAEVGTANLAFRTTPYLAGTYFSGSSILLDGTIELDGDADDVFIFQASTETLTVMANSTVSLLGTVQACNVYWQVGSSATLGTNSVFVGTILAYTSIAAQTGATIQGQLLAGAGDITGAVTLDDNYINSGSACVRVIVGEDDTPPGEDDTPPGEDDTPPGDEVVPVVVVTETGGPSASGGTTETLASTGLNPAASLATAVVAGAFGLLLLLLGSRRLRVEGR